MICIQNYHHEESEVGKRKASSGFSCHSPCGGFVFLREKKKRTLKIPHLQREFLQQKTYQVQSSPDGAVRGGLREVPHLGLSGPRKICCQEDFVLGLNV